MGCVGIVHEGLDFKVHVIYVIECVGMCHCIPHKAEYQGANALVVPQSKQHRNKENIRIRRSHGPTMTTAKATKCFGSWTTAEEGEQFGGIFENFLGLSPSSSELSHPQVMRKHALCGDLKCKRKNVRAPLMRPLSGPFIEGSLNLNLYLLTTPLVSFMLLTASLMASFSKTSKRPGASLGGIENWSSVGREPGRLGAPRLVRHPTSTSRSLMAGSARCACSWLEQPHILVHSSRHTATET